MNTTSRLYATLFLALLLGLTPSCGSSPTQVQLNISQDGSQPCLGAAHMEIMVITQKGVNVFHEFGQFFNGDTHECAIGQFKFPDLPFGNGVQIALSMWDSTSDSNGQLASGASPLFNVKEDGPTTQLNITLSRTNAQLGTVVIARPPTWNASSGVNKLQYWITPANDTIPVRSGYFSYAPELRADPFPLVVSSLPLGSQTTELVVVVEALRDSSVLATWQASAWLGPDINPTYIQFP